MRILTLTNLFPNPFQPNRSTFNRQQVGAVAGRHEVMVVSPILWTDEFKARWRGAPALPAGRQVELDGIVVEHPRYWYTPKVLRGRYGRFFRWSVRPAVERALTAFRPDVIFAPWAYPDGWACLEFGQRAGIPVVIKLHGSDLLTLDQYPARRAGTDEVLQQADGLIAVSRDLAEKAIARGASPERVRVVYDGVNRNRFHPGDQAEARQRLGLPADGRIALFIGNHVPVKGLDVLVRACSDLAKDPKFGCYLIGDGPLRPRLQRQAAATGLADRVHLMGPRPHAQLPDWFRAADVFILSSRSEGVPSVLLEAAACGTPFVASRVGGIPEIAHLVSSRLVPPGDAAALAAAVADVLREGRPNVTGPCPVRSWDESATELAEVLAETIGAHVNQNVPVAA